MVGPLLSMGATLLGLGVAASFGSHLFIGFAFGYLVTVAVLKHRGFSWQRIREASVSGVKRTLPVVYILALISILLPVWIMSGTVPSLILLGIRMIDPAWMLPVTFVIAACTSFTLGTSIGTLSSLGIAIMGIASSAHVNESFVAGALVSGAFFGDRTSPVSSAFHLVANSSDSNSRVLFRRMLPTTWFAFGGTLLLYFVLGWIFPASSVMDERRLQVIQTSMEALFHLSWLCYLPILVIFGSILFRQNIIRALAFSILSGLLLIGLQSPGLQSLDQLRNAAAYMWRGYHTPVNSPLAATLHGGGFLNIAELLLFIILAGMMNGILDASELLKPLIERWLRGTKTFAGYTIRAVGLAGLLSLVGGNQTFPILLTARALVKPWREAGYPAEELGRVVADSALVLSGLVPWNIVAVLSVAAVGVPTLHYLPYAILLWLTPLVTVLVSARLQRVKSKGLVEVG